MRVLLINNRRDRQHIYDIASQLVVFNTIRANLHIPFVFYSGHHFRDGSLESPIILRLLHIYIVAALVWLDTQWRYEDEIYTSAYQRFLI